MLVQPQIPQSIICHSHQILSTHHNSVKLVPLNSPILLNILVISILILPNLNPNLNNLNIRLQHVLKCLNELVTKLQ